jgi:hypothetical protein
MPSICIHTPLYKTHPLWPLRRLIVITIAIGFFLNTIIIGSGDWDSRPNAVFNLIIQFFSLVYVSWDLLCYIHESVLRLRIRLEQQYAAQLHRESGTADQNPEAQPATLNAPNQSDDEILKDTKAKWPRRITTILDAVFAVLFLYVSILTLGNIMGRRYYYFGLFPTYENLATLYLCYLHSRCFWKQYMARKKAQWELERNAPKDEACECCGRAVGSSQSPQEQALGSGAVLGCNADCPHRQFAGSVNGGNHRWVPTYRLPKFFSGRAGSVDLEAGTANAAVPNVTGEDSLLLTPSENENEQVSGSYGTTGESSTGYVPPIKEHRVKKKAKGKGKERVLLESEGEL